MDVLTKVRLSPPDESSITAQVSTLTEGAVELDGRPGEAFKPIVLSSMRISPNEWDTQAAYAGCRTLAIPDSDWIVSPPMQSNVFGLIGGASEWKTNAPTLDVVATRSMQVTGWVTPSIDPNDDNVGFWASLDQILPSWAYRITATDATALHCLFLPLVLREG